MYFPAFPSPVDEDGNQVCRYMTRVPDQVWLNEIGGTYNPETGRILIPYSAVSGCVLVPYSHWYKILDYAAETEVAVRTLCSE